MLVEQWRCGEGEKKKTFGNEEKTADLNEKQMTDAVASWKAYVSATAAGRGAYGAECAQLSKNGMTATVETHFVEATEVRACERYSTPLPNNF